MLLVGANCRLLYRRSGGGGLTGGEAVEASLVREWPTDDGQCQRG
jgi:hypothetical protein